MAKFGPGTSKPLSIKRSKEFKATGNAIENKNRPEALYITISTWAKPKLSLISAKANSTSDPNELAVSIAKEFDKNLSQLKRKVPSFFSSDYFDTSSVIFTYDFAPGLAVGGKRQFIEIEINIDTVNDIDMNDNPIPSPGTGKTNMIPFKDFVRELESAVNKILELDAFNKKKSNMDFSTTKGK